MENGELRMENLTNSGNPIVDKSLAFAIRVVKLYKYLTEKKKEFVIAKQLLRSGTAIGALIRESEHGQSKPDFLHKMNIALKEANETLYWLILLKETKYISTREFNSIYVDANELVSILVRIVKTTKGNIK